MLALGAFLVGRAVASDTLPDSTGQSTNRPAFSASLRGGETVGDNQVHRVFLNVGTNQFAFIVPNGFRMDATDPQKIVLYGEDSGCYITVRVTGSVSSNDNSQDSNFRSTALGWFPGARITDQFADAAAGHTGMAYILGWSNAAGIPQSGRASFIPCAAGVLEFSAMAPANHFREAQNYLTILMTSVCSNETGKLVIVPRPDFS